MATLDTKERILVIEDSEEITSFLVDTILKPSGYEPLLASNGEDGLRMALEHIRLAVSSSGNTSLIGSHLSFLPSSKDMFAKWQSVDTRCPISAGK